jgi:hypothetical protein
VTSYVENVNNPFRSEALACCFRAFDENPIGALLCEARFHLQLEFICFEINHCNGACDNLAHELVALSEVLLRPSVVV